MQIYKKINEQILHWKLQSEHMGTQKKAEKDFYADIEKLSKRWFDATNLVESNEYLAPHAPFIFDYKLRPAFPHWRKLRKSLANKNNFIHTVFYSLTKSDQDVWSRKTWNNLLKTHNTKNTEPASVWVHGTLESVVIKSLLQNLLIKPHKIQEDEGSGVFLRYLWLFWGLLWYKLA